MLHDQNIVTGKQLQKYNSTILIGGELNKEAFVVLFIKYNLSMFLNENKYIF